MLTTAIFALLMSSPATAGEDAETLAEAMIFRNDGATSYRELTLLTCRFSVAGDTRRCASRPVSRTVESVRMDVGERDRDSVELAVVLEPSAERGLAFLQRDFDDPDREVEQWMYLPAMDKLKRIVAESPNRPRTGSVFGSELSYEDAERMQPGDYVFSLDGEETVDGRPCDVLEAVPTAEHAPRSSYSRQRIWVDRETKTPLRREAFDKRTKTLAKSFYARDLTQVGEATVARQELIVNHKTGHMTLARTDQLAVDLAVDESLFEQRALKDRAFREGFLRKLRSEAQ